MLREGGGGQISSFILLFICTGQQAGRAPLSNHSRHLCGAGHNTVSVSFCLAYAHTYMRNFVYTHTHTRTHTHIHTHRCVWIAEHFEQMRKWLGPSPLASGNRLSTNYPDGTKRFTWWPHLWLGLGLAIAPVGGYLAVTGRWSDPWWVLLAITVAVATWVAGFDIFYALPDEEFDRQSGLKSAVVKLGERRSILLAKLLHGLTIPALVAFGFGAGFGVWYYVGVVVATGILAYEHHLVRPGDHSRLDAAFFTMNGVMAVVVFGFALIDVL